MPFPFFFPPTLLWREQREGEHNDDKESVSVESGILKVFETAFTPIHGSFPLSLWELWW